MNLPPPPRYKRKVQIGNCTLYHGDCREIMPLLPKGLVISDPPYNVGYHYNTYSDSLPTEEYYKLISTACPPPCVIIHYAESLVLFSMNIFHASPDKMVAWVYPSNTERQWRAVAWFGLKPDFTKDSQPYRNTNDKRIQERIANGGAARVYDWWEINQVKNISSEKTEHPCQIPESLMVRIIKITSCNLVIDPFMGSGTTGIGAMKNNKHFIGIERDELYFNESVDRIKTEWSKGDRLL